MDCEELKNLTPEMEATFQQLQKVIMKEYGPKQAEDEQIYRFLKARDFDFKKAETMLVKHIKFREDIKEQLKTYKMDELQKQYLRVHIVTNAKDGIPVAYVKIGVTDFKGLIKSVKQENIIFGLASDVFDAEAWLDEQSKKLNRRVNRWSIILDLENLDISLVLSKQVMDFAFRIFGIYEANFPERLKSAYIINTSPVFTIGFNMVKPLLTDITLSKLKIYGRDGWKDELLKAIHEKDLPKFLGGTKTGPNGDPYCNTIREDRPIPKECYFRSPERRLRGKKDVKECILKRGETFDVPFDITEAGSQIFWKFETENGDISFKVFYQKNCAERKEIIPKKRVNAHMELEEGSSSCEKVGMYILTFDNKHSWYKPKCIFYKTFIVPPYTKEIITTS